MSSKYYEKRNLYINNWVNRLDKTHCNSMKNELDELIETANRLSNRLDEIAKEEINFCEELSFDLEIMSWEAGRWMDDLKEIKQYVG